MHLRSLKSKLLLAVSALVMISRKLLKILFALVHNHSVYQEQYSVRQAA
jgi:hypothetical protein